MKSRASHTPKRHPDTYSVKRTLGVLLSAVIILSGTLITPFARTADAAPSVQAQRSRTVTAATSRCLSSENLKTELSVEELTSFDIFKDRFGGLKALVDVGYEIRPLGSAEGGEQLDGQFMCDMARIKENLLNILGVDEVGFFGYQNGNLLDAEEINSKLSGWSGYVGRVTGSGSDERFFADTTELTRLRNHFLERGYTSILPEEENRRVLVALSACLEETGGTGAGGDVEIDDVSFKYREGWSAQENASIGYDLGFKFFGTKTAGRATCSTLTERAQRSQLIANLPEGITLSDIRSDPTVLGRFQADLEAQADTVENILASDLEKIRLCLLGATSLQPEINTPNILAQGTATFISAWLTIGEPDDPISVFYNSSPPGPFTANLEREEFTSCLIDAFGSELSSALEEVTANPEETAPPAEQDVCLAEGSQYIAWLACPVIELVDDVILNLIQNTIQDMLVFKISEEQDLRAGWNVFRSFATILIVAGFLFTLLVKTIRGE